MIAIGNFFFHYRNMLFPLFYAALLIPSPSITGSYALAAGIGLAICLLGQAIRVLTIGLRYIIRGGSKRRIHARDLVTDGMFSHWRNPLYVGNILVIVGLGFIADSVLFLAVFVPLFLFIYQAIVRAEENFLEGKFGDDYRAYMHDVNRWLPSFTGIGDTFRSMEFKWKRVFAKEYNATFIWMTGALLVFMKNVYVMDRGLFDMLTPWSIGAFAALVAFYVIVRFLKKTKRLREA